MNPDVPRGPRHVNVTDDLTPETTANRSDPSPPTSTSPSVELSADDVATLSLPDDDGDDEDEEAPAWEDYLAASSSSSSSTTRLKAALASKWSRLSSKTDRISTPGSVRSSTTTGAAPASATATATPMSPGGPSTSSDAISRWRKLGGGRLIRERRGRQVRTPNRRAASLEVEGDGVAAEAEAASSTPGRASPSGVAPAGAAVGAPPARSSPPRASVSFKRKVPASPRVAPLGTASMGSGNLTWVGFGNASRAEGGNTTDSSSAATRGRRLQGYFGLCGSGVSVSNGAVSCSPANSLPQYCSLTCNTGYYSTGANTGFYCYGRSCYGSCGSVYGTCYYYCIQYVYVYRAVLVSHGVFQGAGACSESLRLPCPRALAPLPLTRSVHAPSSNRAVLLLVLLRL